MSVDVVGLVVAVFVAAAVEFVEAFTIVLAMGMTRGWRSALAGTAAAVVSLAVLVAALGIGLRDYVSAALLQLVVGALLLGFGLQWLRKAIFRSAGLKALHDEEAIFERQRAAATAAVSRRRFGVDGFGFVVAYKGVFLEGLEVVFIVITFGLGAAHRGVAGAMGLAAFGAAAAGCVVVLAGVLARRPLAMVPENTMKHAVGVLLSSFGLFWAGEGLGYVAPAGASFEWPGGTWMLLIIIAAWIVVTRLAIASLRSAPAATEVESA